MQTALPDLFPWLLGLLTFFSVVAVGVLAILALDGWMRKRNSEWKPVSRLSVEELTDEEIEELQSVYSAKRVAAYGRFSDVLDELRELEAELREKRAQDKDGRLT